MLYKFINYEKILVSTSIFFNDVVYTDSLISLLERII